MYGKGSVNIYRHVYCEIGSVWAGLISSSVRGYGVKTDKYL